VKVIVEPGNGPALDCFKREFEALTSRHIPRDIVPDLKKHQNVDRRDAPTIQPFLVIERVDGRPILEYVGKPTRSRPPDRAGAEGQDGPGLPVPPNHPFPTSAASRDQVSLRPRARA
jgi:hypothetical protein